MATELEKRLAEALREAIEWNWLDEVADPPAVVVEQIESALAEYDRQQVQP